MPLLVEYKHRTAVINRVVPLRVRLFPVIGDSVTVSESIQCRIIPTQPDKLRTKVGYVALEDREGVALRVDTHEQNTHARGARTKCPKRVPEHRQRRRTRIRALRVPEVKQYDSAAKILCRDDPASLIPEREFKPRHETGDVLQEKRWLRSRAGRDTCKHDQKGQSPNAGGHQNRIWDSHD